MAKKLTLESLAETVEALETRLAALEGASGDADDTAAKTEAVEIPASADVADMEKADAITLATQLGIETEGVKLSALKALLTTAAAIHHDEDVDDLEEDAVNALAEACGIGTGKLAKTLAALKKYLEAAKDTEAEDTEEAEETEEEETEEEEEEAKPAKKKAKKPAAEEEEEEEAEEKEEEAEEEEEVVITAKHLVAYNKIAKKKCADIKALKALLTDDADVLHAWGTAYVKGEDSTAYCCGLPLKDSTATVDGEEVEVGKCIITKKLFKQDEDTQQLVEVTADEE